METQGFVKDDRGMLQLGRRSLSQVTSYDQVTQPSADRGISRKGRKANCNLYCEPTLQGSCPFARRKRVGDPVSLSNAIASHMCSTGISRPSQMILMVIGE